jgi:hypothetical protein
MDNKKDINVIHYSASGITPKYNTPTDDSVGDSYNHIIDNIYVGSVFSFTDEDFISELDQIISLIEPPSNITNSIKILFEDMDYVDILPYAEQVYPLLDTGKKTLVHCLAGRSRSCGVVLFYMMEKHHMSFTEAYTILKTKRPATCINNGFLKSLQLHEICENQHEMYKYV